MVFAIVFYCRFLSLRSSSLFKLVFEQDVFHAFFVSAHTRGIVDCFHVMKSALLLHAPALSVPLEVSTRDEIAAQSVETIRKHAFHCLGHNASAPIVL